MPLSVLGRGILTPPVFTVMPCGWDILVPWQTMTLMIRSSVYTIEESRLADHGYDFFKLPCK